VVEFVTTPGGALLEYQSEMQSNSWVWSELQTHGSVTISRAFTFERGDLVAQPTSRDEDEIESFVYEFRFASRSNGYFHIEGRILDIPNKVLIADVGLDLSRKLFVAERNIPIFRRISKLLQPDQDIVIGGDRAENIPIPAFKELLKKFPNSTELDRYANARVGSVLGDYFDFMKDAREHYESYLNRTGSLQKGSPLSPFSQRELLRTELEKYVLIRDTIIDWLRSSEVRSEREWQKMIVTFLLLIFPKYLAVLENVQVEDSYSIADATRNRFIDIALVDASGNIDLIEIKKPFDDALLSKTKYRANSLPSKELSGSIMQAEKYLFHLSKWGTEGEKKLTSRYKAQLPTGMQIRIILGRDRRQDGVPALDSAQMFDLEVIKRKYANMVDIMTYDDLLRRLQNIIDSLSRRADAQG
jgi:Domain of unknown function (DUF4263)